MKYFKKISGNRIYLSPINADDVEIYTKWLNDPAVSINLGSYSKLISLHNERSFLEKLALEGHNYAIVTDGGVLLGNIGLFDIDGISRTATVGLFIGEASERGKGYGAEALRLIVAYGFKTLNLQNIMLNVNAANEQALACYKKVGFREFGRRRAAKFIDGCYVDDIYMEILSKEFFDNNA